MQAMPCVSLPRKSGSTKQWAKIAASWSSAPSRRAIASYSRRK